MFNFIYNYLWSHFLLNQFVSFVNQVIYQYLNSHTYQQYLNYYTYYMQEIRNLINSQLCQQCGNNILGVCFQEKCLNQYLYCYDCNISMKNDSMHFLHSNVNLYQLDANIQFIFSSLKELSSRIIQVLKQQTKSYQSSFKNKNINPFQIAQGIGFCDRNISIFNNMLINIDKKIPLLISGLQKQFAKYTNYRQIKSFIIIKQFLPLNIFYSELIGDFERFFTGSDKYVNKFKHKRQQIYVDFSLNPKDFNSFFKLLWQKDQINQSQQRSFKNQTKKILQKNYRISQEEFNRKFNKIQLPLKTYYSQIYHIQLTGFCRKPKLFKRQIMQMLTEKKD